MVASNTLPCAPSEQRQGSSSGSRLLPPLLPTQRCTTLPLTGSSIQSKMDAIFADTDATLNAMKERSYQKSLQNRRSIPNAPSTGSAVEPRARPASLSEGNPSTASVSSEIMRARIAPHVAQLEQATASVKASLGNRRRAGGDAIPVFKAVCRNLVVGQATSSSCSPLTMFSDRLEYKFRHQQHGCVQMLMWFKDMQSVQWDQQNMTLSFHVARPLRHFGIEYDAANGADRLCLQLCSAEEAVAFTQQCNLLQLPWL